MSQINISNKDAVKRINATIKTFTKLRKEIGSISGTSATTFRKLNTALRGAERITEALVEEVQDLHKAYKNVSKSQKSFVTQLRNAKKLLKETQEQLAKTEEKLNKIQKKKGIFKGILGGVKQLLAAFGLFAGLQLFRDAVLNAFKLTRQLDSLQFAMKAVIRDSRELAETQAWLKNITEDFGAEIVTTTERYIKFRAAADNAGLSAQETQKIFGTLTKASGVLGLRTDELRGIYLALEQMISKGKITTEELRRQLGERLPGAMDIMAQSMGVTTAELDEMLKKGEVITKEVLPKFADQVEIAFGLNSIQRVETLQAATSRLRNAWVEFIETTNEVTGASDILRGAFDFLAENLETISKVVLTTIGAFVGYKAIGLVIVGVQALLAGGSRLLSGALLEEWAILIQLRREQLKNIVVEKAQTASKVKSAQATVASAGANITLTKSLKLLTRELWLSTAAFLATPHGMALAAIGLLVGAIVVLKDRTEEQRIAEQEKNSELLQSSQQTRDLVSDTNTLIDEYDYLIDKEDKTTQETQRLNDIIVQLGKNIPLAVIEVDEFGNALEINADKIKEFTDLSGQIANLQAKTTITSEQGNLNEASDALLVVQEQLKTGIINNGRSMRQMNDDDRLAYLKKEQSLKKQIATSKALIDLASDQILKAQEEQRIREEDPGGEKRAEDQKRQKEFAEEQARIQEKIDLQTVEGIEAKIKANKELIKTQKTEGLVVDPNKTGEEKNHVIFMQENIAKIRKIQAENADLEEKKNKLLGIQNNSRVKELKQLRLIRDLTKDILNLTRRQEVLELEVVASDPTRNFAEREAALRKAVEIEIKIREEALEIEEKIIDLKAEKERQSIQKELGLAETSKERKVKLIKQLEAVENETKQKKKIAELNMAAEIFNINQSLNDDLIGLENDRIARAELLAQTPFNERITQATGEFNEGAKIVNNTISGAESTFDSSDKTLADRLKRDRAIEAAQREQVRLEQKYAQEIENIRYEMSNALIDLKIHEKQEYIKNLDDQQTEEYQMVLAQIEALEASRPELKIIEPDETKESFEDLFETIMDLAGQFASAIGDIFGGMFDANIARIDAEIEATEEKFDRLMELEEGNEENLAVLRRNKEVALEKLEKKRQKEEIKKKKAEKAQALVDIAINTAVAISRAPADAGPILGLSLVSVLVALGALQAAAVLAQPIPKYKDGIDSVPKDQVAMINDGGRQEYVERDGQILTTREKNAIVPLMANDTVYKSYDDMAKRSMLMNGVMSGIKVQPKEFDSVFLGMSDEIRKGFKGAKVNNNIKLVGFDSGYQAYKDKISSWS